VLFAVAELLVSLLSRLISIVSVAFATPDIETARYGHFGEFYIYRYIKKIFGHIIRTDSPNCESFIVNGGMKPDDKAYGLNVKQSKVKSYAVLVIAESAVSN